MKTKHIYGLAWLVLGMAVAAMIGGFSFNPVVGGLLGIALGARLIPKIFQ